MKNQKGVSLITLIITIIVVIILAVIVLRSGASDAPDQAAFSGFTQEMGELQDNMTAAMLDAKGKESLKGNQRSEAQLYNFLARGGYNVVSGEKDWLLQSDAENIPCTLINKDEAVNTLGAALPTRKVETALGTNQEVSYFVTPKGTVFCWPPYVYDGKSYVNANVEDALALGGVAATEDDVTLVFNSGDADEEKVVVSNDVSTDTVFGKGETITKGVTPAVWYGKDGRDENAPKTVGGVAQGFTFEGYSNENGVTNNETPAPTPTPDPDPEG